MQVRQLLALTDWAPTHGLTELWRFQVHAGDKVREFCLSRAGLYKELTAPDKFLEVNYVKLLHMGDQASHLIVSIKQCSSLPKIPA